MGRLNYYFWLLDMAVGRDAAYWPVTGSLLLFLALTAFVTVWQRRAQMKARALWCFSPFSLTAFILVLGTVFQNPNPGTIARVVWPVVLVYGALVVHIPVTVVLWSRLKEYFWLVVAASVLSAWTSFWATLVTIMSITGDWL